VRRFKNLGYNISKEDMTKVNMDLIHWTKRYAKKILNKLVGLKSS